MFLFFFKNIMDIPPRSWPILRSQSYNDKKRKIHTSRNPVLSSDHPCLQTGEEILLLNIDIWVKQRHAAALNGVPKKLYWHAGMYMISCFTKMKCKMLYNIFCEIPRQNITWYHGNSILTEIFMRIPNGKSKYKKNIERIPNGSGTGNASENKAIKKLIRLIITQKKFGPTVFPTWMFFLWNVGIFTHNTPVFFITRMTRCAHWQKHFPVYMDEKNYLHPKKNLINFVANFSFLKLFKVLEQIGRFCKAVVNFIMIFFVFGKKT